MLVEIMSPAFKERGKTRPPIKFNEGLNVILGKDDGAMSIGKSSALLAIDFVFGGNTYIKSDGVRHEGDHTIFFTFKFNEKEYHFARSTRDSNTVFICDSKYNPTGRQYTLDEFTTWLKKQYKMDFPELSFRTALSSFFRIYGKKNIDELNPLQGTPGQNMEKSVTSMLKLFNKYRDIEVFKTNVDEHKNKLDTYKKARKYEFISNLVGGQPKYEENLLKIRDLELQLGALMEQAENGHTQEEIKLNKKKADLTNAKLSIEQSLYAKERKLRLVSMNLEYGLYPTESDLSDLQEYFPEVNLRKLYEVEKYHQKLANILDNQFAEEKESIKSEIQDLKEHLAVINSEIQKLGITGNISKEFLDKHSELTSEINALKVQNKAFLTLNKLKEAKENADHVLKKKLEDILYEIEQTLNDKMKTFNDSLFTTKRKPPHIHFNTYNSYKFETPDNTGTGSNYKGMIVYDLAILYTTALPALAHDSLLFKNLGKNIEDGIIKIYNETSKQIFIAYDKQGDCRKKTQNILENNCVLRLSTDGCELYGRSWDAEEV